MDEVYDIEYRTVAPDGRTRWVRAIGAFTMKVTILFGLMG